MRKIKKVTKKGCKFMINIIEKSKYKNIKKLYGIKDITEDGYILLDNKQIGIYKVEPINIINSSDEYKIKIYSTYLSCIKSCNNIQILIKTEKQSFDKQIEFYAKRLMQIECEELKNAIKKYIEYLEKQNQIESYTKQIFIIVDNKNNLVEQEIKNFEQSLLNIGVRMKRINKIADILVILKESMLKDKLNYA